MKFILSDRAIRIDSLYAITCNTVKNAENIFINCKFTERVINIMVPQYTENQFEITKTATIAVNSACINSSDITSLNDFKISVQECFKDLIPEDHK